MTLRNIFMYEYKFLLSHNCGYLHSEERTNGGFLRMATEKPPCPLKMYIYFLRICISLLAGDPTVPFQGIVPS